MRLSGLLTRAQVEGIHAGALRVLSEVGLRVEHEGLCGRFTSVGGRVDGDLVTFMPGDVERLIQSAPRDVCPREHPAVTQGCNVYQCEYLDPATDLLQPFNEDRLARHFGLAESLGIQRGLLGLPFVPDDIPARYLPLAEKLYAWKHGASPGGSVHFASLCEPLIEMFGIHADANDLVFDDAFRACGWMISPLRLARPECEQLLFFADRGLRMSIGHQPTQGGSAPVTFAGALILALAEQLFLFLLNRALWGEVSLGLTAEVSPMDLRTGALVYGRPEQQRMNLAFADIADFYGCPVSGHTGCTDAHMPSFEAGAQKATGALVTALATGSAFVESGLLGVDEICSPVQMVLDHDLVRGLNALLAGAGDSDIEEALSEIVSVGIGGDFLGTPLTAERYRAELCQPATWSNQPLNAWRSSGSKNDMDKAREIASCFEADFAPSSRISEEEDRELRNVIRKAVERGI